MSKYGPAGSTIDDLKWAYVSNTTYANQDQWLVTITGATLSGGYDFDLYYSSITTVVITIDSGTTLLAVDSNTLASIL